MFKKILFLLTLSPLTTPSLAWEAKSLGEVAIYPERTAQAQVLSLNESRLAAEIAARVEAIPVEPGQTVKAGALVARLDCRDQDIAAGQAQAALDAAQARAKLAGLQLERSRKLAKDQFLSADALDVQAAQFATAQADVGVQKAALAAARRGQEKCVLRAPFPAIVQARLGQVGEMAAPGTPLVGLLDRSRIQVKAEVQAEDADGLSRTKSVDLLLDGRRHRLRLLRVSPSLDPATRLREARLAFAGTAALPGGSGRLSWREPAPHLPAKLLVRRDGRLGVFIAEGNKPRFHPLPQAQEGRPARATGLAADTRVVVSGQNGL